MRLPKIQIPRPREGLFRVIGYTGLIVSGTTGVWLSPGVQRVALSWQIIAISIMLAGSAVSVIAGRLFDRSLPQQVGLAVVAGICLWVIMILAISAGVAGMFVSGFIWYAGWASIDRVIGISMDKREKLELLKAVKHAADGDGGSE
jgi:hypothetical protein